MLQIFDKHQVCFAPSAPWFMIGGSVNSLLQSMAGLTEKHPRPLEIKLHKRSRVLEISFDDGANFKLPFEFLRVYSPSAEVRGHAAGQEQLQVEKQYVDIDRIEPVGHYAVQLYFSDRHSTGIYSWDYLYDLGVNQHRMWQDYLERLAAAGASRQPISGA